MKKAIKITVGIMLIPIAYALFIVDRVLVGTLLPHLDHPKFIAWCDVKYSTYALFRIMVVSVIYLLIWLIL